MQNLADLHRLEFTLQRRSSTSDARVGQLRIGGRIIDTPCFMPVGTQAAVKGLRPDALEDLGYGLILANTYHLHLRPGETLIARAGGLHAFAGWPGAFLTDSGGYQVFSLASLRRIEVDGIRFRSHIDGAEIFLTPERAMAIQRDLGADIVMAFDQCAPHSCGRDEAEAALERTHRWAERCAADHDRHGAVSSSGRPQALFGIVQGSVYRDLREAGCRALIGLDLPGYAIGGLAVGESREERNASVAWCTALLPEDRPRYLMGVGTPRDLAEAVSRGVDMFDCVLPTRNGRTGQAFTSEGLLNLRNARYAEDFAPIDPQCRCYVCQRHSRAYIRHLFMAREMLGPILTSHHNLAYYGTLMARMQEAIATDSLASLAAEITAAYPDDNTCGREDRDGSERQHPGRVKAP